MCVFWFHSLHIFPSSDISHYNETDTNITIANANITCCYMFRIVQCTVTTRNEKEDFLVTKKRKGVS